MKAQYLTLEYLIFFVIGIVLIVSVYYSFSEINRKYELATTEYQLRMTGEMIIGNAIRVFETSNNTDTRVVYDLEIPTKLSNCVYSVRMLNGFLRLECIEGITSNVNLTSYNFNIKIKNNILYSTDGTIRMTAENGEIDLE
jgi:hypothetical protein